MLAGAGFGNDPLLAHPAGEEDLANRVVNLVRSGMAEVFTLEIDFRAAKLFRQSLGKIQWGFSSGVLTEVKTKFLTK